MGWEPVRRWLTLSVLLLSTACFRQATTQSTVTSAAVECSNPSNLVKTAFALSSYSVFDTCLSASNYVCESTTFVAGATPSKGTEDECANVDGLGQICLVVDTTTMERAELKRDQIHAYGPDPRIPRCQGSMSAEIEPAW